MRLPFFDFHRPTSLEETLSIMAGINGGARVLAGGTDLIPRMKYGLDVPRAIVSLKGVAGLRGIKLEDNDLHIGAMTPLSDLLSSRIITEHFPALYQAAEGVAAPPLWNVATVGGNICQNSRCCYYNQSKTWRLERAPCLKAGGGVCHAVPKGKKCFSVYSGDLAPALIAAKASVFVEREGRSRILSLQEIFSGNGLAPFTLESDELITSVIIPMPAHPGGSGYVKMRLRSSLDYPLISAAASITLNGGKKISEATLVLGAVGPAPVIAVNAGKLLKGRTVDTIDLSTLGEALNKGIQIVDNLALPGSYRRKMLACYRRQSCQGGA